MNPLSSTALIARINEMLRQEQETFNQRKRHENLWFMLRVAMGYTSIILLASVMGIAAYILFSPKVYSQSVLTAAGGALFVDVLGLLVGVWKIALNPDFMTKLTPVTNADLDKLIAKADEENILLEGVSAQTANPAPASDS